MSDYECTIIEDSLHPNGRDRLTTLEFTLPRPFLVDFNTHRVLSRNSESSRAKPPKRRIEEIRGDGLWVPTFGSRVTGMGQGPLDDATQAKAQALYRTAASYVTGIAEDLDELGVDKSHINRLLEPFVWQRILVTSDNWDNFLALRTHSSATPEIQIAAGKIAEALRTADPVRLRRGEWHLPYVTRQERTWMTLEEARAVSVGRCAKISYDRTDEHEALSLSQARHDRLWQSGHMSPFENQARPATHWEDRFKKHLRGNFAGAWVQYRKTLPHEENFAKLLEALTPYRQEA